MNICKYGGNESKIYNQLDHINFFLLGGYSHYTSLFEFKRKLLENSIESDI